MTCGKCQRDVTLCICENADERLKNLKDHPNIDHHWIERLIAQRYLNRFDIEKARAEQKGKK